MRALTSLMLVVGVLSGITATSIHADTIDVPFDYGEIGEALENATANVDTLLVDEKGGGVLYHPFTMKLGVPVLADEGDPVVDASDTTDYAVVFPAYADGLTDLVGFELRGGNVATVSMNSSGRVKDCKIYVDDTPTDYGIRFINGGGVIQDCEIYIDDSGVTTYGVYLFNFSGSLEGTTVEIRNGTASDWGIYGGSSTTGSVAECFVKVPDGGGIYLENGSVQSTTVDSTTGAGIDVTDPDATADNCIATNSSGGAEIRGATGNVDYCIAYPTGFGGGTTGTGNSTADPLYCGSGAYTLRVDSYGNSENNASGYPIGAYGVTCMYGTLARDATFAGDGSLAMTDSVLVPSGTTLTLEKATTVNVTELSPISPLLVEGTLRVNGESGDEVVFQSAESTPGEGDWYGIKVNSDDKAFLEYATIQHANYGLFLNDPDSVIVDHCTFTANQSVDIVAAAIDSSDYGLIQDCTITVGGGTAIKMSYGMGGLTIADNAITGNSTSANGIYTDVWFSESPTISGNTLGGFINGSCARLSLGSPVLTTNTLQNSKYGIELIGGSPAIGTSSSSSDNTITGNTTGIQHDGASATGVILNNQITSNTYGVVNKQGSANLGGGNGVGYGYNTLTGNTTYCLWNRSRTAGDTLWAQGNYYGACTAGNPPWCWNGLVVYTAALCTAPAAVISDIIEVSGEPKGFRLLGAWPNPMTAANEIAFVLDEGSARVSVHIFDVAGRLVRELPEAEYGPGQHSVHWDGRNRGGDPVRGGIYFIRLAGTNGLNATAKVLVAR